MTVEGLFVHGNVTECKYDIGELLAIDNLPCMEFRQCDRGSEENFITFVEETIKYPQHRLQWCTKEKWQFTLPGKTLQW